MNSNFKELLLCLKKHRVRFLVVGGYAVIHYAQPRFTRDLNLWIDPSAANAKRLVKALAEFGILLIGIEERDFAMPGTQFMLGQSPVMLDFLTSIPPLHFADSWEKRKKVRHDFAMLPYLSKADLITAKKYANRKQDQADVEELLRT